MTRNATVLTGIIIALVAAGLAAADTSDRIFDPRFRTLKTEVEDNFMSAPVIRLGTNDRILVSFDEIGEDNSYLEYRLIHCNADWQPSRLIESEYVAGFNSQRIEDFAFSSSTFVHYVNYLISIPNEEMQILHSGNYLLQVYDPDDPDRVLLQTRFCVSENSVRATGTVTTRTDRGVNGEWQQLELELETAGMGRINPYQDFLVQITQNVGNLMQHTLTAPLRVEGDRIIYDHQPELIFPASNEWRRFESVSNGFPGMHVDSLRYMGSNYHVWLKPDAPRAEAQYSYDRTQHGRFLVHEYNATDSSIGADYITVHFLLESPEFIGGEVYVDGEFTHGRFDNGNRMVYDRDRHAYTAEIPLKQGAYNYRYAVRKEGSGDNPDPGPIEGNKYETENEYGVAVYFRPPGARADRLVSYTTLQTGR